MVLKSSSLRGNLLSTKLCVRSSMYADQLDVQSIVYERRLVNLADDDTDSDDIEVISRPVGKCTQHLFTARTDHNGLKLRLPNYFLTLQMMYAPIFSLCAVLLISHLKGGHTFGTGSSSQAVHLTVTGEP